MSDSARISPTAHYTSFVHVHAGTSHPALATPLGRALHVALRPMNRAVRLVTSRPDLDQMVLARHAAIDHLLERAIAEGAVGQVLEVAAGLSPRGMRLARRHPTLRYVEADLPAMAELKRRRLDGAGLRGADHRVVELDALADDGPCSLAAIAGRELDPARGLAIVTEGLLGYFDRPTVESMWRRFAALLGGFPSGRYVADLYLADDVEAMPGARLFVRLLGAFARGSVHVHHRDGDEARRALLAAGFREAEVRAPGEIADVPAGALRHAVRIVEART